MKLSKSIDLAHQTKSKIPNINISSINQNNTYYNEISRNIKKSSKARNRKIFSHDSFNGEDFSDVNKTHNITINKILIIFLFLIFLQRIICSRKSQRSFPS